MNVRCVITGHDPAGKSVVVRDEQVQPITISGLGMEFHRVWGTDSHPLVPSDGRTPLPPNYFPSAEGYRFGFFTVPPESGALSPANLPAIFMEIQRKLPGMAETLEMAHPGMHTTQTVDFDVVLSGEIWLELDDGKEVLLHTGDCVVQNGTRHAWHNRSSQPCVFAVCLLGASRNR